MNIKPTRYRGYNYLSRTEARWAVFFSVLQIPFQYEPETFIASDGKEFTPSFFLPDQRAYVKVVNLFPALHQSETIEAWTGFCRETPGDVRNFIFIGDLPDWATIEDYGYTNDAFWDSGRAGLYLAWDNCHAWTRCKTCGAFDICFEARSERIKCGCPGKMEKTRNGNDPAIVYAYRYAKAYRFEQEARKMRGGGL